MLLHYTKHEKEEADSRQTECNLPFSTKEKLDMHMEKVRA